VKWATLEEVSTLISKGTTPTTLGCSFVSEGVPFLRAEDVTGTAVDPKAVAYYISAETNKILSRSRIQPGDLLITIAGTLGRIGYVPMNAPPLNCNQAVAFVRLNPQVIDLSYASFACQGQIADLLTLRKIGTIGNLNLEQVRQFKIPLPPLCEQKRIAKLLNRSDRLHRARRYSLELTDTFLPSAFLELFGDPAENPRNFDRVQVEDLFSDSRDGAKCGPFGSALKKHEYVATGIPVWTMNNVRANEFVEDGCLYITPKKFEELSAYDSQNGDILISRAGTVGRMAIVRTRHPRSVIHSNIIRLSLNDAKILPIFFVVLMTWFAPRVARLKRGQEDAYSFMSTGSLGELQIPLPPFSLQQKFAALAERVERLRTVQRESLRQAEHLFASLLHRAFSY
jgi:type I restriction enzyme S subunit